MLHRLAGATIQVANLVIIIAILKQQAMIKLAMADRWLFDILLSVQFCYGNKMCLSIFSRVDYLTNS